MNYLKKLIAGGNVGEIYISIDFTGATYSIEGYGDSRIGSGYFDIVEE